MKKIAFSNQKGGVGKTTTTVNVGAGLAELGYKTVIIDLDTQGQVTQALAVDVDHDLAELFEGNCTINEVQSKARDKLFVMAGGHNLAGIKRIISRRDVRPEMALSVYNIGYGFRGGL